MRRVVRTYLPRPEEPAAKSKDIPKPKFNKLLKEFLRKKAEMMQRLAGN
jgi:hypothetical protein